MLWNMLMLAFLKRNYIEAYRNTESIDLLYEFPKFVLVRSFFLLHRPMHRTLNERSYWFIERALFNENNGNTKKINFQFYYRKFSKQRNSLLSYYYKRLISGRRGRGLSCTLIKIGRKCFYFGKKSPNFGHGLNFSFTMQVSSFFGGKT